MKRICLLFILITCFSYSQNKQVLYGFSEIPQSLGLNPGANIDNDWYIGIPLLSHVHASFGMSGLSAYDVFADDGRDFNSKLQQAVYSMKDTDFFAVNQQLDIFSGGFAIGPSYNKNKYISYGLYQETDIFIYFPKDYAVLAYEGNYNNINRVFDLSDLNLKGEVVSVLHVGFNKKVSDKFTYGFRGKIYSSVFNFNSVKNQGTFNTVPSQDNYLKHVFNLDLELQTSGIATILGDENSDFSDDIPNIRSRLFLGGNLGLGFDVGFTYNFTNQWSWDASLVDIGYIKHSRDIENYKLEGALGFEGINPIFPESGNGQTAEEYWDEVSEDFDNLFDIDSITAGYTTWRPVKFNTSLKYAFGKKNSKECNCILDESGYQNAVGAQLFAVNRPKQPQLALTAFYYRRLFNGLRFKATYTVDSYSFKNVGLGMSTHIGPVNFYIMADNLLEYQNLAKAQSVSLQLGFNYIFKQKDD